MDDADPRADPTPEQVAERWQWLLERLTYDNGGEVVATGPGRLEVTEPGPDGTPYTVLVTPEQWALIASPVDPTEPEPHDFDRQVDEERFLVFHEGRMWWSVREELPPVPWFPEILRERERAAERGEDVSDWGWFAYTPLTDPT